VKWGFSMVDTATVTPMALSGSIHIPVTEDEKLVIENSKVAAAFALKQASEASETSLSYIQQNQRQKAIDEQEKSLKNLRKFEKEDDSGMVRFAILSGENVLDRLRSSSTSDEAAVKSVSYSVHQAKKGTASSYSSYSSSY